MAPSAQNLSMQNGSRMPTVKARSSQLCIICQFLHLNLLSLLLASSHHCLTLSSYWFSPCQSHACLHTFRKCCFLYVRCSSRTLPISTNTPLYWLKCRSSAKIRIISLSPNPCTTGNHMSPSPTFLRERRCCNPWSSIWKPLPEQLSLLLVPETYKHKPSLLPSLTSPDLERSPHSCLGKARPPTAKARH